MRVCPKCQKTFEVKGDYKKRIAKYCSVECYLKARWGFTKEKYTGQKRVKLEKPSTTAN